jgi:F0F1-type ATP synthase assembly protein I
MSQEEPKYKKYITGAYDLSVGISMVLAIFIGIGLGLLMRNLTGIAWLFWLGVFWGVGGAILNIYKAYKRQLDEYKELEDDVRYKNYLPKDDDED